MNRDLLREGVAVIRTRLGPLRAWWHRDGTLRIDWNDRTDANGLDRPMPRRIMQRLASAADGRAVDFDDIPTPAGTVFQRKCWSIARRVPPGSTLTYGEVARRAGSPGAARAVGQAMRRNPIPLIVPCHRVVASTGLGGYSGTSVASDPRCRLKATLLELERLHAR